MAEFNTRETLLLKIRDSEDEQAWGQFVELYTPLVFSYCRRRGLGEHDASDVTQEVMRAISRAITKFEYDPAKGSFRSWFYTVARSKLNNYFTKQARQPLAGGTAVEQQLENIPDASEERDWEIDYKRQMFAWAAEQVRPSFKEHTWQAFWKTAVEDQDPEAVGRDLGMNRGAVYAAKARALKALKECVQSVAGEWDLDVV